MKVRDVVKLLENDGWRHKVSVGSHKPYVHPLKKGRVTVRESPVTMYVRGR